MQSYSRSFTLFFVALFVGAGCHSYLPSEPAPAFAGTELAIHAEPDWLQRFDRASAPWRARYQARLGTQPVPRDQADIWFVRPAQLPALVAADLLHRVPADITNLDADYDWRGLLPSFGQDLLLWDRVAYALPLAVDAPVCFYPSSGADEGSDKRYLDWQRSQRLSPEFPFGPPRTWQQFERLAAFLTADLKRPALPPLPADDGDLGREFYQIAASFARHALREDDQLLKTEAGRRRARQELFFFHYNEKTADPRIDTEGFVEALQLMQRLQKYRPPGTSATPSESLMAGRAVLGVGDAGLLAQLQKSATTRGRFAVCAVPGSDVSWGDRGEVRSPDASNRLPYLGAGGWLAVVPKSARSPEAAWAVLAEVSGPVLAAQLAHEPAWGGGSVRVDPLLRTGWGSFGVEGKPAQQVREALGAYLIAPGLQNPVYALRTIDEKERSSAVVQGLRAALLEGKDAQGALTQAADIWRAMDAKIGKNEALARYRESVGLTRD